MHRVLNDIQKGMRKVPNIIKALKRLMLVIIAFAGLIIGITHAQANDNRQIGYL